MHCTLAFAINCNDDIVNCRIDPSDGVGDMKVIGLAESTLITNCKGTLLNGTVDDEFMKSSICRAMA